MWSTSKLIKIHLGLWFLVIAMDIMSSTSDLSLPGARVVGVLLVYYLIRASFFYFFFLLLIPRLFQQRRAALYLISSLGAYVLFVLIIRWFFIHIYGYEATSIGSGTLLYFLTSLVVLHLLAHITFLAQEGMKVKAQSEAWKKENYQKEAAMLRSQVNPHFLFNSLNTIYNLSRKNDEQAPEAILELAEMMRYMTDDSQKETVLLKEELDHCRAFIQLMRRRVGGEFELSFHYPKVIPEVNILPLSLLPLIENAFKHADLSSEGFIHIYCDCTEEEVSFKLLNKIDERAVHKRAGIGLKNLQRRLELRRDTSFSLKVDRSQDNVYKVELIQKNG